MTLDIRDAPNLTAVIEGPGSDNSILQVGEPVYINGTAQSFGATPTSLSGNLSFGMRELNGGGTFVELFNQSVNGAFTISHILDVNSTFVRAGNVELELIFYPDNLDATDSLNTSGTEWFLQGLLVFELLANSQLRGQDVGIIVQISDHLGSQLDLNLTGNFTFDFDGSTVNTTTDPGSSTLSPTFAPSANLAAGDYTFNISFDGNDFFLASNSTTLRIMGTVDVTVSVIDDWTYLGNTTWLIGDITDDVLGTSVLGNDSRIIAQLVTTEGLVFDLANGMLNNTTGSYNLSITAPTVIPSGVYDVEVLVDFDSVSQPGGPLRMG